MSQRVYEGQIVDCPLQDGATMVRGTVVQADDHYFVIESMTLFKGQRVRFEQGRPGVVLVADG